MGLDADAVRALGVMCQMATVSPALVLMRWSSPTKQTDVMASGWAVKLWQMLLSTLGCGPNPGSLLDTCGPSLHQLRVGVRYSSWLWIGRMEDAESQQGTYIYVED